MGGGRDTSEYRTIFACAIDLRLAIHCHDITQLEDKLSSRDIISKSDLSSQSISKGESAAYESSWRESPKLAHAASLVWLIQSKVEQDAKTFHTFIGLLEEDKERYSTILSKLRQTYVQFEQGHKAKKERSMIIKGVREDVLKSLVCDDDDCRGRRIRHELGYIVTKCVQHVEHHWQRWQLQRWQPHWHSRQIHKELSDFGMHLGLSEDELKEIMCAVPELETQVRLMIYQWSSKDKLRGEGTVQSFMETLYNGDEMDLLIDILDEFKTMSIIVLTRESHELVAVIRSNVAKSSTTESKVMEDVEKLHLSDKEGERQTRETRQTELTAQATTKVDVSQESYDPAAATGPHIVGSSTMGIEDLEKLHLPDKESERQTRQTRKTSQTGRWLNDGDYDLLCQKLGPYAARWRDIGVALGFKGGELDNIQYSSRESPPNSFLLKMLADWLWWAPGDGRGSADIANTTMLSNALRSIGLGVLAVDILKEIEEEKSQGEMQTEMFDFKPQETERRLEVMKSQQGGIEDLTNIQTRYSGSKMTDSTSSKHQQEPPVSTSHQISIDKRIPFIKPPQTLEFDSAGTEFVGFDEIRIEIPPNAIPVGSSGSLQVGVCLYGPFMFEENHQPISPILWLCLQGENTHLDKPISVTLPHILSDASEEELTSLEVSFAKAGHECVTNNCGERVYQFQPSLGKASYYWNGGRGFGVLQTDHFCYLCMQAGLTHDPAVSSGYYLVYVQHHFTVVIFTTFFLKTCLTALQHQIKKLKDYEVSHEKIFMKLRDHLRIVCDPSNAVNMKPYPAEIHETEINFWGDSSRRNYARMKLEHDRGLYPPQVTITARRKHSPLDITISVPSVPSLGMQTTLPYEGDGSQPSINDFFTRQECDDTSDYEVTKPKVEYSIPVTWNFNYFFKSFEKKDEVNGAGVTVAVLDSSINKNHTAFTKHVTAKSLNGKTFIEGRENDGDYWFSNREQHGTMVAGIVAQLAPEAEIFVCCVSDGGEFKSKAINKALKYLLEEKNCQVIIMSFGGPTWSTKDEEKEFRKERKTLMEKLCSKGVICVAAAGNNGLYGGGIAFPACLSNVIAVGGLDKLGYPAKFNHRGPIDVYGPGEKVAVPSHDSNNIYQQGKGSSCAAPAIGGIVALLMHYACQSGVTVNNVELLKKIFSDITCTEEVDNKKVFIPTKFFGEYNTKDKFKTFIESF